MKSKKNSNPTTDPGTISKSSSADDFFYQENERFFPTQEAWRKRFIKTLISWANQPDSLDLVSFCRVYCMYRQHLYQWAAKYDDIATALNHVRMILGERRRTGALKKEFSETVAFRDMHVYDSEFLEINKYNAALRNDSVDSHGTKYIVIPEVKNASEGSNGSEVR